MKQLTQNRLRAIKATSLFISAISLLSSCSKVDDRILAMNGNWILIGDYHSPHQAYDFGTITLDSVNDLYDMDKSTSILAVNINEDTLKIFDLEENKFDGSFYILQYQEDTLRAFEVSRLERELAKLEEKKKGYQEKANTKRVKDMEEWIKELKEEFYSDKEATYFGTLISDVEGSMTFFDEYTFQSFQFCPLKEPYPLNLKFTHKGSDDVDLASLKDPHTKEFVSSYVNKSASLNETISALREEIATKREQERIDAWLDSDKDGIYNYHDYQIVFNIKVTGDTWRGETVLVSGMGESYDNQNAIRSYGKIVDYVLYNNIGARVGTLDHKGIHTSVGNNALVLKLE